MKNLKKHVDGMMMGVPLPLATSKLANEEDGSTILITARNGQNLFIKEDGVVRDSTMVEWETYWTERTES